MNQPVKINDDLIVICAEIGCIASSNSQYTDGLSRRIKSTGKSITELTVCELLTIHREYGEWFNNLYKQA